MAAALAAPHALQKLEVVDTVPTMGATSPALAAHIDAMPKEKGQSWVCARDAQAVLRKIQSVLILLAFLLADLETAADATVRFLSPLGVLGRSVCAVSALPFAPGECM
jgi:hypothetical protein